MGYLTFRGFIELLYSLLRPDSEFITAQPKPKSSLPPTTFLFVERCLIIPLRLPSSTRVEQPLPIVSCMTERLSEGRQFL